MKKLFTLIPVLTSLAILAQPEITQINMPQIGDHVIIAICSDPLEEGNPGANQTWDMSGLTESEEQFFTFIQPSQGALSDSFPNANLCAVSWLEDYSYYNLTSVSHSVEGHVIPYGPDNADTALFIYDNTEQILELPYTYNSSFSDDFEGAFYMPGFTDLTFDGSIDFEADGYGTLILPDGTYNNVIRYHFFREQDNYFGGIPSNTTKEQWAWVSSDYRFWLLLMEENWDGFSFQSLIWYNKNPIPVTTGLPKYTEKDHLAFPNPLKNGQNLNIMWDKNESAEIYLFRTDGSLVGQKSIRMVAGANLYDLNSPGTGLYILTIKTDKTFSTQKVSVMD